jgi:hypothetical protein
MSDLMSDKLTGARPLAASAQPGDDASAGADLSPWAGVRAFPRVVRGAGAALLALFAFQLLAYRHAGADDAFITYRYAEMLGAGEGIRWAPGAQRLEASTSMLFTLLLGGASALGVDDLYSASKVVNVLSALGFVALFFVTVLNWVAARKGACNADALVALLPLFAVVGNPDFGIHLNAGLEAMTSSTLIFCSVVFALSGAYRGWTGVPLGVVLFLVRPDAPLPFTLALFVRALLASSQPLVARFAPVGAPVVGAAAVLAVKYSYFGKLFPTSASKLSLPAPLPSLSLMVEVFLQEYVGLAAVGLAGFAAIFAARGTTGWKRFAMVGVAAFVPMLYLSRIVWVIGYHHRFVWNQGVVMMLGLFAALGLVELAPVLRHGLKHAKVAPVLFAGLAVAPIGASVTGVYWDHIPYRHSLTELYRAHGKARDFMVAVDKAGRAERAGQAPFVGVIWDAGLMAVGNPWQFIDAQGLNTGFTAAAVFRHEHLQKDKAVAMAQRILAMNPDLIVYQLRDDGRDRPYGHYAEELRAETIAAGWVDVARFKYNSNYDLILSAPSAFAAKYGHLVR